jgi:phosphatidylglycerophosphatase A
MGCLPRFPGTWGTLGAALIALALPRSVWLEGVLAVFLAASFLTVALGKRAERVAGGKDPGFVVQDEVAGYLVTVFALDKPDPVWLAVGFVLFRITDIWKPWPARLLEKLPAGVGVLLDDVAAGLYGLGAMVLLKLLAGAPPGF